MNEPTADKPLSSMASDIKKDGVVLSTLNTVRKITSPYQYLRNRLTATLSEMAMSAFTHSPLQTIVDQKAHLPVAFRLTGEVLDTMQSRLEKQAKGNYTLMSLALVTKATRYYNCEYRGNGLSYIPRSVRTRKPRLVSNI